MKGEVRAQTARERNSAPCQVERAYYKRTGPSLPTSLIEPLGRSGPPPAQPLKGRFHQPPRALE